jgi:Domain of unknown function (DUF5103)
MRIAPFLLFAIVCTNSYSQKNLQLSDRTYEPQIRTVQLYPNRGGAQDYLFAPVVLIEQMNLVIEFDDLQSDKNNYYAKIIHCTYDWQKSTLSDLDFLTDYNEVTINDYTVSSNSISPYIHYQYPIPQVKIPGNYVIIVYRDGDQKDLILSHRFMVYQNVATLVQDNQLSGTGTLLPKFQELNYTIDYSQMDIVSPLETVHVVLRQNQRWDNAKFDFPPSFVRDADSQLDFHYTDQDKLFAGGNEFRFVDFNSLSHPGQNTGKLVKTVKPYQLYVQQDKPRTDQAYSQYNDNNGNYLLENQDAEEPKISSGYVEVTFSLLADAVSDSVYLAGAFNNWNFNDENRMKYYTNRGAYEVTILLKQGLYNYQYFVDSKTLPANYFEGDHFETENMYEVLVYNHSFQPNADMMIGYFIIDLNPR